MTLTAVLFVGGQSRRMGTDKATLAVAGEPLWARQLRVLRELQPTALRLSARARPAWCPPELEVVLDASPSRGPLSGLAAALQQIKTTHLLALAIDLPRMTTEPLSRFWALARPGCGVIPVREEFFEPLCAIYPVEAAALTESALAGEDVSLQSFARTLLRAGRLQAYPLTEAEKPFFHNLNSPADLPAEDNQGES
jgi:molybdopterin-guanine dinucleotide biosynthesis protein A